MGAAGSTLQKYSPEESQSNGSEEGSDEKKTRRLEEKEEKKRQHDNKKTTKVKTEGKKGKTKEELVEGFLEQQVASVSVKVARSRVRPSLSYSSFETEKKKEEESKEADEISCQKNNFEMVSQSLKTSHQRGESTLRAMARRHHARQFNNNSYFNSNTLVQVASFLQSFSKDSFSSKRSPVESTSSLKSESKLEKIEEAKEKKELSGIAMPKLEVIPATLPSTGNNLKKKFNLNLKIQVNDDEDDWIQVSDDDDDFALTPRKKKDAKLGGNPKNAQSYTMTQSGTIFVNGFCEGIGKHGIKNKDAESTKLPMRERLVMLCKLGQGCSSIVFKALDLTEMQLVALKMVPVHERDKRRQMVRELSALFQVLHKKRVATEYDKSCMHVSLLFDLKKINNQNNKLSEKKKRKKKNNGLESPVLAKRISSSSLDPKTFKIYPQEYIVDFYDAFSNVEEGGVGLMMEYMDGGSLQDIADNGGCEDEGVLANIAVQGLAGLDFLHSCNQIHRDIKPANLLINLNGDVKVSDLGILRQIDIDQDVRNESKLSSPTHGDLDDSYAESKQEQAGQAPSVMHRVHTFVGTTTYMSPERLDGQDYSYPCDIWAFGLSLLTVALGRLPLDTKGGFWGILQSVRDSPPPQLPDNGQWSDEFRDFLSKCLQQDPNDRSSTATLLQHPFLSKAKPDDPEILEEGPVEELEAIVSGVYSHLKAIRTEMNRDDEGAAVSTSAKKPHNLLSIYETAHRILFGEAPGPANNNNNNNTDHNDNTDHNNNAESSGECIRLAKLAHQLHLDLKLATQVAKDALYAVYTRDMAPDDTTPKVHHSVSPF